MIDLGYPYIAGYKPLSNYQSLLFAVVAERVGSDRTLRSTVRSSVEAAAAVPQVMDLLFRFEDPPEPSTPIEYRQTRERLRRLIPDEPATI
jgi:hypothetical protein